jgi:hypothetical protein
MMPRRTKVTKVISSKKKNVVPIDLRCHEKIGDDEWFENDSPTPGFYTDHELNVQALFQPENEDGGSKAPH